MPGLDAARYPRAAARRADARLERGAPLERPSPPEKSPLERGSGPLLAAAVVLPYLPLLFGALPVSDDVFVSDFLDGELPVRVELGRQLARGEGIDWTPGVGGGRPLAAAGAAHPLLLALHALLPPAPATAAWLLAALLVLAFGARALARRAGASALGALLAGALFAHSGFVVCHVRHVSILLSVAPFPWALAALDGALAHAARDGARATARRLAVFSLLFGATALGGFPQISYIAGLAFAAWAAVRIARAPAGAAGRAALAGGTLLACALGAGMGALQLLPLRELASVSDRSAGVALGFAERFRFWLPNALSFLVPFPFGDVSTGAYRGEGIFWEDYGYAGLAAAPLALWAVVAALRGRGPGRGPALGLAAAGLVAFLLALGPATPLHGLAHALVPGMSWFRLPTRFLFVTQLALCVLAGAGLSALEARLSAARARLARLAPALLAAAAVADVAVQNVRHNGLDDGSPWLEPPAAAALLPEASEPYRVFTPLWSALHRAVYHAAGGWNGDAAAYRRTRELLHPNAPLLWGGETVDAYLGLSPRWSVDLWGDHNRAGLLQGSYRPTPGGLETTPDFFRLLALGNVRFLASPLDVHGPVAERARAGDLRLYELPAPLPRVRVVARASRAPDEAAAARRLLADDFDPRVETVLAPPGPPLPAPPTGDAPLRARATIVRRDATRVAVDAESAAPGWLVLAETWYPGWEATIDGAPAAVERADVAWRAVRLPAGRHEVVFRYRSQPLRTGLAVTALCAALAAAIALATRRRPASAA